MVSELLILRQMHNPVRNGFMELTQIVQDLHIDKIWRILASRRDRRYRDILKLQGQETNPHTETITTLPDTASRDVAIACIFSKCCSSPHRLENLRSCFLSAR
jgi:hypothetical protein